MSRNTYGFDFLKKEHTLDEAPPRPALEKEPSRSSLVLETPNFAAVALKPDLEKQFDVIHFLQAHRSAGYLAPNVIYKATGIDLGERDESVAKMLALNPKIRVEHVPDPENPSIMLATYAYQAKFNNVRDRSTLLAQINRMKNGVATRDLVDAYDGVEEDISALITAGDVLAIANPEDKDKILFPRGEPFLVELDGIVTMKMDKRPVNAPVPVVNKALTDNEVVAAALDRNRPDDAQKQLPKECSVLETDVDPIRQIRRGEAVCVGGQWFRVSSAVREGVPLSEQPPRAQAPLSVVSMTDLSKKNEVDGYVKRFNSKMLPLDASLSESACENLVKAKEARERLHKLASGRGLSGGVAAQLLSPLAHSSNPSTLAASFGSGGASSRKRPSLSKSASSHAQQGQARKDAEAAAQQAAADPSLNLYTHARRHGCTKDVRTMYLDTRKLVPEDEEDLHKLLIEHKLIEPGEAIRRPRLVRKPNVDNDGKPKKRRYYERKNQRMTNVHLQGTEIGAVLARATEKQRQGKAVGDGGM